MFSVPAINQLLFGLLLSLCIVGINSTPAPFPDPYAVRKRPGLRVLKTTHSRGKILDWIPRESQGKIAKAPPLPALRKVVLSNYTLPSAELEQPDADVGPSGTVPILRLAESIPPKTPLPDFPVSESVRKRQTGSEHIYVSSNQNVNNVGASARFSTFKPFVRPKDFSLVQMAIASDRGSVVQTVEAGWMQYPQYFGAEPHLFTYLLATISSVAHEHQAVITSATYAFRSTGSTIGVTIASAVYQNLLSSGLHERFDGMPGAEKEIRKIRNSLDELKHLPTGWKEGVLDSYAGAFRGVYLTAFGIAVLGTVCGAFMREHTLHKNLARRDSQ